MQLQRTFLTVLFLALVIPVISQVWCPPGATWVYAGGDPMVGPGQTRFSYVGDTVVDGFAGQRIAQTNAIVLPWWAGDSLLIADGPGVVTRTEPGMVLWWLPQTQEWDTLYWFGARPGDKWSPGWAQYFSFSNDCATNSYLQVVDTGTAVVDGVPLRTLFLEGHLNATEVDFSITIMERVGNTSGYMFPFPPDMCFINEAPMPFSCYSDDGIRYPTSSLPCELTLGMTEARNLAASSWSVSPIPFRDHFSVQATYPQPGSTVSLLDMTGRELLSAPFRGSMLELDASEIPAGTYLLRIGDGQGNRSQRKVIKE